MSAILQNVAAWRVRLQSLGFVRTHDPAVYTRIAEPKAFAEIRNHVCLVRFWHTSLTSRRVHTPDELSAVMVAAILGVPTQ